MEMLTPPVLETFVQACKPLAAAGDHAGVKQLLTELIADPGFAPSVPPFDEVETSPRGWTLGGEHLCYQADELTVMVLDTLPGVVQPPHDHEMQAIIGVFEGREDQRFFGRTSEGVVATSERALEAGDVMVLGEQAIHAISSPEGQPARAIHVYFGDIYDVERSLYHPDSLEPLPYSSDSYDELCRPSPAQV